MFITIKKALYGPEATMYDELERDTNKLRTNLESSLDNLSSAFAQIKEYQVEIEEARDFWKLTFDAVNSPVAIIDHESKIINANKTFIEVIAHPLESFVGESICKIFCNANEKKFSPCMECCAQDYVYKNNRLYKIKFNKILDHDNQLKGCVFVANDITEEQKMQEYLAETTAKYIGIFNAVYDAILLADLNTGTIVDANPAAARIYGYRVNEFNGMNLIDLTAEPEKTLEALSSRAEQIPLRFHKRKDGTIVPVEISTAYYEHANKLFCVSVIRDISSKISNEALHQCLQKLLVQNVEEV